MRMEVKIVNFPATKVAVLEHHGSPALEHESVKKLIAWRIENKLPLDKHKNYGIHYNNPATTPADDYRVDLCISVDSEVPKNPQGVINKIIPSGRCAVARHIGSRNNVTAAAYLYEQWLPNSGEKIRDYPLFFHYVNIGKDIKEQEMITDVYLPLQ